MNENVNNIITSSKTGFTVAAGTSATGVATMMEWVTGNIGWIASTLGAFLTLVLVAVNVQTIWRNWCERKRDDERYASEKREQQLREELLRVQINHIRNNE